MSLVHLDVFLTWYFMLKTEFLVLHIETSDDWLISDKLMFGLGMDVTQRGHHCHIISIELIYLGT